MPLETTVQCLVCEGFISGALPHRTIEAPKSTEAHRRGAPAAQANRRSTQGIDMNEKLLGEIAARLAEAAASNPARDLEKNARAVLTAAFARLDLVTREEFDVQSEVLARARTRVAELETKVAALEARLAGKA